MLKNESKYERMRFYQRVDQRVRERKRGTRKLLMSLSVWLVTFLVL
jgi:hypothetical protein